MLEQMFICYILKALVIKVIDFIENEISKNVNFKTIFSNLELEGEIVTVKDFSLSANQKRIEDKNIC